MRAGRNVRAATTGGHLFRPKPAAATIARQATPRPACEHCRVRTSRLRSVPPTWLRAPRTVLATWERALRRLSLVPLSWARM